MSDKTSNVFGNSNNTLQGHLDISLYNVTSPISFN